MLLKVNKYGNKKVVIDGEVFDSQKEAKRYTQLLNLQRAGEITNLKTQVPYELIPPYYEEINTGEYYKRGDKKGAPKTKRVLIEHGVKYVADFVYVNKDGKEVVEDTKSKATKKKESYIIKRKLMIKVHGIKIQEV